MNCKGANYQTNSFALIESDWVFSVGFFSFVKKHFEN